MSRCQDHEFERCFEHDVWNIRILNQFTRLFKNSPQKFHIFLLKRIRINHYWCSWRNELTVCRQNHVCSCIRFVRFRSFLGFFRIGRFRFTLRLNSGSTFTIFNKWPWTDHSILCSRQKPIVWEVNTSYGRWVTARHRLESFHVLQIDVQNLHLTSVCSTDQEESLRDFMIVTIDDVINWFRWFFS